MRMVVLGDLCWCPLISETATSSPAKKLSGAPLVYRNDICRKTGNGATGAFPERLDSSSSHIVDGLCCSPSCKSFGAGDYKTCCWAIS